MKFSQQNESAKDRTKLFLENPSLKLKAELLLSWLKDVGDLDEDTTLDDIVYGGDYFDMDLIIVEDKEYAVGDEYDTRDSCYNYIKDMIETEGIETFNKDFVEGHLDIEEVINYAEEYYTEDINDYPEAYFDDKDRMLSGKQLEQVEILTKKKERLENGIKQFQNAMGGKNDSWLSSKMVEFNELIDEYEIEIEEINSEPEGEFPDELIEERIADNLRDVRRDPWWFIDEFDVNWERFVDVESLIEDLIDTDGYGHFLARYDGEAHEVYADGDLFYIMRID
jgi:hypothetical protein